MLGVLIKGSDGSWHLYQGSIDGKWLCNMPTKTACVAVGKRHGCTRFVVEKPPIR